MTLQDKILSIKETLGGSYVKPNQSTVDGYVADLSNSTTAFDYLSITRGLTPETIAYFKLGYCKEKNAISIPIYKRGELINIRYRHLDENAKAKYTQEKGCEVWVFNEDGIAKGQTKGGILIVEGEFDCISAWQAGFKNVISPASGKDSYGVWIELLDSIAKVFISYDNDKPGKGAALGLSERIGTDKSFEVLYPEGIKDANEYFKVHTAEEYKELIRNARPFYKYKFQGVSDIIESIREKKDNILKIDCIPFVEFEEDWLAVVSGMSNIGKTSYVMNVADELVKKNIPTLVLPIERGIRTVGKRFLQTHLDKTKDELDAFGDTEWKNVIEDVLELPLYFSMPSADEVTETVKKAKRLFNIKVVILDHLDLLVRKSDPKNINQETSTAIQNFKKLAQELNVIFLLVHHVKKPETGIRADKKPVMSDLKGSSSIYQDPEAVIMLSQPEQGAVEVDILKNKGAMGSKIYKFNFATGRVGNEITHQEIAAQKDFGVF